jgi:hypothetical protein
MAKSQRYQDGMASACLLRTSMTARRRGINAIARTKITPRSSPTPKSGISSSQLATVQRPPSVFPQLRAKAVDPQQVLKDWRPMEFNALLSRPLFDESLYEIREPVYSIGQSGEIRTPDPLLPKQVLGTDMWREVVVSLLPQHHDESQSRSSSGGSTCINSAKKITAASAEKRRRVAGSQARAGSDRCRWRRRTLRQSIRRSRRRPESRRPRGLG